MSRLKTLNWVKCSTNNQNPPSNKKDKEYQTLKVHLAVGMTSNLVRNKFSRESINKSRKMSKSKLKKSNIAKIKLKIQITKEPSKINKRESTITTSPLLEHQATLVVQRTLGSAPPSRGRRCAET